MSGIEFFYETDESTVLPFISYAHAFPSSLKSSEKFFPDGYEKTYHLFDQGKKEDSQKQDHRRSHESQEDGNQVFPKGILMDHAQPCNHHKEEPHDTDPHDYLQNHDFFFNDKIADKNLYGRRNQQRYQGIR